MPPEVPSATYPELSKLTALTGPFALVIISYFYSNPKSKCPSTTKMWGPGYPNFQQNFQVIGTISPNYFPAEVTLEKGKEVLLRDKIPIKSACLGKPGALGGCKATSMAKTNPCQAKHFPCYQRVCALQTHSRK